MPKASAVSAHYHPTGIRQGGFSALGERRCARADQDLLAAAETGEVELAERALRVGVSPQSTLQALIKAAGAGQGAVVELLLHEQSEFGIEAERALQGAFGDDLSGIRRPSVRRAISQTLEAAREVRSGLTAVESSPLMLTESQLRLVGGRQKAVQIARHAGSRRALVFLDELAPEKPVLQLVA